MWRVVFKEIFEVASCNSNIEGLLFSGSQRRHIYPDFYRMIVLDIRLRWQLSKNCLSDQSFNDSEDQMVLLCLNRLNRIGDSLLVQFIWIISGDLSLTCCYTSDHLRMVVDGLD